MIHFFFFFFFSRRQARSAVPPCRRSTSTLGLPQTHGDSDTRRERRRGLRDGDCLTTGDVRGSLARCYVSILRRDAARTLTVTSKVFRSFALFSLFCFSSWEQRASAPATESFLVRCTSVCQCTCTMHREKVFFGSCRKLVCLGKFPLFFCFSCSQKSNLLSYP